MKSIRSAIQSLWVFQRPDCEVSIRLHQPGVLIAFALLLAWYILFPTAMAAAGTAALGSLLLIAYLWARSMAGQVRARRKLLSTAFQVGDELEETVELENRSLFPALWAEISDGSNLPGYRLSTVRAAGGAVSASNPALFKWNFSTICKRRGVFKLGPWELRLGADPFGLFSVRQVYPQYEEILVYPPLADLPAHALQHHRASGDQRPLRQPLNADTIQAIQARSYQPGDPLRHIHWRTTARRDAPYVKIFEPEATSTAWIIPDMDAGVQAGEGESSTVEAVVTLAATLSLLLLHQQLAVGLYAGQDDPVIVQPQAGVGKHWNLLRAIAPLQPVERHTLAATLARAAPLIRGRDHLVIITPSLDPAWATQTLRFRPGAQALRPRAIEAVLLDPVSFAEEGKSAHTFPILQTLAWQGIPARLIRRGDIRLIPAAYGPLRRWEFSILASGRAVVRQTSRSAGRPGLPGE